MNEVVQSFGVFNLMTVIDLFNLDYVDARRPDLEDKYWDIDPYSKESVIDYFESVKDVQYFFLYKSKSTCEDRCRILEEFRNSLLDPNYDYMARLSFEPHNLSEDRAEANKQLRAILTTVYDYLVKEMPEKWERLKDGE